MSNALAIAAVTSSLVNLISQEIGNDPRLNLPPGVHVTALPPDGANNDSSITHQVNLFLYHAMPNAAWRNMPLPTQVRQGESGIPPLALNLYYMVTAYSRDTSETGDVSSHALLGRVMSIFHDNPILGPSEIVMPESDVQNQVDKVRITLQPLSIEEIYRLWTGFQTQYRMSVTYEVSVILIDSTIPTKTPLPVLKRGRDNRGPKAVADPLPYPTLFAVNLRDFKSLSGPTSPGIPAAAVPPTALLGDALVISGHRLDGSTVTVRFTSPRLADPIDVPPTSATADTIQVTIPNDPANWPAGLYTLSAVITQPDTSQPGAPDIVQVTNELPFALAPQIDTSMAIPPPTRDANNTVKITLNCIPQVLPQQRVSLLVGSQEVVSQPRSGKTNALTFSAGNIEAGSYLLRLRVDGVDSFPYTRTSDPITQPPTFDDKQRVTVP